MSRRASRIAFALILVVIGSLVVGAIFSFSPVGRGIGWLGVVCEIALVGLGAFLALTPPPPMTLIPSAAIEPPSPPMPSSAYRGAVPPPRMPSVTKTSAKRITLGILAALAFTAASVPFALHLPRWIEGEVVALAWWMIWSVALGVIAYRGAAVADDHRSGGKVVDLEIGATVGRVFDIASFDIEGCLVAIVVLAVVGVALLGAWLVVELVAPAVFVLTYRGVMRALARARAAETRGNATRSALVGAGWAAAYTAPLAALVGLVHLIALRAS